MIFKKQQEENRQRKLLKLKKEIIRKNNWTRNGEINKENGN